MIVHPHVVQHRNLTFLWRLVCRDVLKMSNSANVALIVVVSVLRIMAWRETWVKLKLVIAHLSCGLGCYGSHIMGKVLYVHVGFSCLQSPH